MLCAIDRKRIRLDSAADLAAYIDSHDDDGRPVPDYYRAILSVVRRSPAHGAALERFRTPLQLFRYFCRDGSRQSARCLRTIGDVIGTYTDGRILCAISARERDAILSSAIADIIRAEWDLDRQNALPVADLTRYYPVADLKRQNTVDPASDLTLTSEESAPVNGEPSIRLRRGRQTWVVRADLWGFLARRYPTATFHARHQREPVCFVIDGAVFALLMPSSQE